jgi:hypothetical protein
MSELADLFLFKRTGQDLKNLITIQSHSVPSKNLICVQMKNISRPEWQATIMSGISCSLSLNMNMNVNEE